jgi:hypothetical protein
VPTHFDSQGPTYWGSDWDDSDDGGDALAQRFADLAQLRPKVTMLPKSLSKKALDFRIQVLSDCPCLCISVGRQKA